jgi:hypothetical protein
MAHLEGRRFGSVNSTKATMIPRAHTVVTNDVVLRFPNNFFTLRVRGKI